MAADYSSRVVSLRWPNDVIEAVDEAAEAVGESRTAWVMDACRRKLDNQSFAESFEVVVENHAPERLPMGPPPFPRGEVSPRWKKGMTK